MVLDPDDTPITLRELWEHAMGCAAVAARIATQVDHVSPHQAFAAGFLHDMGRLLLYRCSKEGFYTAITVATAKRIPLSEAETLAVGMNHVTLGEIWAGRSELPHGFQQVIRYHHEPRLDVTRIDGYGAARFDHRCAAGGSSSVKVALLGAVVIWGSSRVSCGEISSSGRGLVGSIQNHQAENRGDSRELWLPKGRCETNAAESSPYAQERTRSRSRTAKD